MNSSFADKNYDMDEELFGSGKGHESHYVSFKHQYLELWDNPKIIRVSNKFQVVLERKKLIWQSFLAWLY